MVSFSNSHCHCVRFQLRLGRSTFSASPPPQRFSLSVDEDVFCRQHLAFAVVITLLFAASHPQPPPILDIILSGLLYTYLYERQQQPSQKSSLLVLNFGRYNTFLPPLVSLPFIGTIRNHFLAALSPSPPYHSSPTQIHTWCQSNDKVDGWEEEQQKRRRNCRPSTGRLWLLFAGR